MKLYQNLMIVLGIMICQNMLAQEGLSGRLLDQNEETVPYATVAVMKLPDSTLVTGTTSDSDGEFHLKPDFSGEFVLKLSAIGYAEVYTEKFEINGNDFSKNFGVIILSEETTMLDDVMIKTWKPRIKVENGNMTMEVEGTTLAAGNTAYEMLIRAPGVSADQNGNLQLNGRSGVAVMLDGRLTYMTGEDLMNLLESMPAENIKSIEVLNNPPSKYDAEGGAGMLNINLKNNTLPGFSGSLYGGYFHGKQQLFNGGVNLNYNKEKWDTYLNFDLSERGFVREAEITRFYPEGSDIYEYRQLGEQTGKDLRPSLNAGADLEINKRNSIGASVQLNGADKKAKWLTRNQLFDGPGSRYADIDSDNYNDEEIINGRFNFNYTLQLDTLGTSLSADVDYAFFEKEIYSSFYNNYFFETGETREEVLFNDSFSNYDIYAARLDFKLPLRNEANFEAGLKASRVISKSNLDYFVQEENERILVPGMSDNFRYEEEIFAAYANYSKSFNDTWSLNAGLRVEQTKGLGVSETMNRENERDYLEFFPNIQLDQKVSDKYRITYSYNRRIDRPAYDRLNPFIFSLDPYNTITGNPDLRPAFVNSWSINQNFFNKYNLMLSYELNKDYNTEIFFTDPQTGRTNITAGNLDYYKSYLASLVAPVEFTSFWNSNNTLVANYQDNRAVIDGIEVENRQLFYMLQSNHQFNLPAGLKMELNATMRGPVAVGIYSIEDQWWLDGGLKRSFINDKLDVTLRFMDIFRTQDLEISSEIGGNTLLIDQYFNQQAVSINLRYNFSKGNVKKNTRATETLEEMDRAGVK